ncbi:hypothetical protein CCACVL1_10326 [Corchorus capsularis]|uniref:ARID domain-containing protein n=1 Tax=Corchorus capsularis TaxID=210143 RepID=A0A1R3IRN4_COCAP|nr:hypothetical protein CCACVL1_10326 [Corchorus capsularis]
MGVLDMTFLYLQVMDIKRLNNMLSDHGIYSRERVTSDRGKRRVIDSLKRSMQVDDGTAQYYLSISDGDPRAAVSQFSSDTRWERQAGFLKEVTKLAFSLFQDFLEKMNLGTGSTPRTVVCAQRQGDSKSLFNTDLRAYYTSQGKSVESLSQLNLDLFQIYSEVTKRGGFAQVCVDGKPKEVCDALTDLGHIRIEPVHLIDIYIRTLYAYEIHCKKTIAGANNSVAVASSGSGEAGTMPRSTQPGERDTTLRLSAKDDHQVVGSQAQASSTPNPFTGQQTSSATILALNSPDTTLSLSAKDQPPFDLFPSGHQDKKLKYGALERYGKLIVV